MLTPDLSKVSPTYNVPVLIDAENGLDLNESPWPVPAPRRLQERRGEASAGLLLTKNG